MTFEEQCRRWQLTNRTLAFFKYEYSKGRELIANKFHMVRVSFGTSKRQILIYIGGYRIMVILKRKSKVICTKEFSFVGFWQMILCSSNRQVASEDYKDATGIIDKS